MPNVSKTKLRSVRGSGCAKYLESQVSADEGCESDVVHRIMSGIKRGER